MTVSAMAKSQCPTSIRGEKAITLNK